MPLQTRPGEYRTRFTLNHVTEFEKRSQHIFADGNSNTAVGSGLELAGDAQELVLQSVLHSAHRLDQLFGRGGEGDGGAEEGTRAIGSADMTLEAHDDRQTLFESGDRGLDLGLVHDRRGLELDGDLGRGALGIDVGLDLGLGFTGSLGLDIDVYTGPATDNEVGTRFIRGLVDGTCALNSRKGDAFARAVCERAIQPDAKARDRELALQILAPERLNKVAQPANRNAIVFNFIGTDKKLDMPKIDAQLPPEPRLVSYEGGPDDAEEVIEADADVA